jgi:hypothetical protein
MPEQEFRTLLDRLNGDAGFRQRFQRDVPAGLGELALSPTLRLALAANDEDSLRRMVHTDVGVRAGAVGRNWLSRLLCTRWFCGPPGTRDWQCPKSP